jgi:hypothetical protein
MPLPSEDEQNRLHRYFGVEYNNKAWDLASRDRTPHEDRELLDVAHASKLHWEAVGTELNKMRGLLLVAHAHASVGLGGTALEWARECTVYFDSVDTEDWERAFTYMIHAQAAAVAVEAEEHRKMYAKAKEVVDGMPDGEDKNIVMVSWLRIPEPNASLY